MKIAILLLLTFIASIYAHGPAGRPPYSVIGRLQQVFHAGFYGGVEEIRRRAPQEYGITFPPGSYVEEWGGKGNGIIFSKRGEHLYWYDIIMEDSKGRDHRIRMNIRGTRPGRLESYQIKD